MGDIRIFNITGDSVTELKGSSVAVEKSLQSFIEKNLEKLLSIRFLESEYSTGKTHGGRIDTLGIDENGCPVIIEYKRAMNENVINQGLFYLDWLLDHKAEFDLLVLEKLGDKARKEIDWSNPRLLCIAGDFTKYDNYAVQQINRNIELLRYRRFENQLLLFELVNATTAQIDTAISKTQGKRGGRSKTVSEYLEQCDNEMKDRYTALEAFIIALGDDVQKKVMLNYIAFKRIANFACVEVHPQARKIVVFVKVDPDSVRLEDNFTRDVRTIGHFGTGDLEITIKSDQDVERAKSYIIQSYEEN
jgi:predicted transport protein